MVTKVLALAPFTINLGLTGPLLSVGLLRTSYQPSLNADGLFLDYGDNGLKRFDQVVKLAEQKGIKLVVTLTNNWADYVRLIKRCLFVLL
jgi:hypothetical protein